MYFWRQTCWSVCVAYYLLFLGQVWQKPCLGSIIQLTLFYLGWWGSGVLHLTDKPWVRCIRLGWALCPQHQPCLAQGCVCGTDWPPLRLGSATALHCHEETFVAASSDLKLLQILQCWANRISAPLILLPDLLLGLFLQIPWYHPPVLAQEVTLTRGSFWPEPFECFTHYTSGQKIWGLWQRYSKKSCRDHWLWVSLKSWTGAIALCSLVSS